MRFVTVLQNALAHLVFIIAFANGQNIPMMGIMPQIPMGQNMFNQPNQPQNMFNQPQNMFNQPQNMFNQPQNMFNQPNQPPSMFPAGSQPPSMFPAVPQPPSMFPAGPQPPAVMSNPFGSTLPGSQNPFGPSFTSMPMPQVPTFPQTPALSPAPQDFSSGLPTPQFNPAPQGPAINSPGPQDFSSGPPASQSNPVLNSQGPNASQGPVLNPPGPQDPAPGSSAPRFISTSGPPESTSTFPGSSGSTSNQQKPAPSSSAESSAPSQAQNVNKRKLGPRRFAYKGRNFRRPGSHTTRYRPSHVAKQPEGDPLKGRRIICIFNNRHSSKRGLTPANIDPALCTHLNYEFAMLDPKTYEIMSEAPDLDIEENFYQQAIDLKKRNQNLKVILALGGWSDSTKKYSDLAADPDKRSNFIEKAISFLKAHEFDGMDFAWEYPNCWQGALGVSPKDKDNFVTLLKEMKSQFKQNGLILSVSVGAIKREVEAAYDVPAIAKIVDFISVMTYDMHGPWEKVTGHHTQFDSLPGDEDPYLNVKGGMQVWIDKGAPKSKLNLGLAFYGKSFRLADPQNCGMGAPAVGIGNAGPNSGEGGFLLYNEICQFLNSGNWTEKEEKNVGFYAYSGDQWVCYDPPMMMVRKAKFVIDSGMGGVLLKDLSGDDYKGTCFSMPFPLVKMVRLEMVQRIRRL